MKNILRSPFTILLSIFAAFYIGLKHSNIASLIAPIGQLYLELLKMCVLPILASVTIISVYNLIRENKKNNILKNVFFVFLGSLLSISFISVAIGMVINLTTNIPAATLIQLGSIVNQLGADFEISLRPTVDEIREPIVSQIISSLVPDNIFRAFTEEKTLEILMFSIIFGACVGALEENQSHSLIEALKSIYEGFNKLIQFLILFLPIGLFCLLSNQFSQLGISVIFLMTRFIISVLLAFACVFMISTLILSIRSGFSIRIVLQKLKDLILLSLATSSSLACIPCAINSLVSLNLDEKTGKLITPLAISLCRFGSIIYFASATLFVAELYNKQIGIETFISVVILSIFAGMATAGATGIVTLAMLDIVLNPLGLPLSAVLTLFIAIDPVMDPLRTLGITYTGVAATTLITPRANC